MGSPKINDATDTEVIDDSSASNAQESVPLPVFAGEARIAVKWISPPYEQRAVEAADRPGKK